MRLTAPTRITSAIATFASRLLHAPRPRRWALVTAWMGLIFLMSAQPNSGEQSGFLARLLASFLGLHPSPEQALYWHHLLRKGAHFTEYAVLASLLAWALPSGGRRWGAAWAIATLYAVTDELHQAYVPNRGPALADVGVDSAGAAAAMLGVALAHRLRRNRGEAP